MTTRLPLLRRAFCAGFLCLSLPVAALADTLSPDALPDGAVVLFRHANAPGTGDPPGMRLDDCATQRNLDDLGRAQARATGEAFRRAGIRVGRVLTSQWCRARETADLAFPGQAEVAAPFNSFFGQPDRAAAQTTAARRLIVDWRGPGVLVVVTHQVNITALTGLYPASGEGIVLPPGGGDPMRIGPF